MVLPVASIVDGVKMINNKMETERMMRRRVQLMLAVSLVYAAPVMASVSDMTTKSVPLEFKAATPEVLLVLSDLGPFQAGLNEDGNILSGVIVIDNGMHPGHFALRCSTQMGLYTTSISDACLLTLRGEQNASHTLSIKTANETNPDFHFDSGWWVGKREMTSSPEGLLVPIAVNGTQLVEADTYRIVYEGGIWTE